MKNKNKENGFTLVEVIITVVIIGIALLPLSTVFNSTLGKTQETKQQLEANQLAQEIVEAIKGMRYSELSKWDEDITTLEEITFLLPRVGEGNFIQMPDAMKAKVKITPYMKDASNNDKNYPISSQTIQIQELENGILVNNKPYYNVGGDIILESAKNTNDYTNSIKVGEKVLYTQTTPNVPGTIQIQLPFKNKVKIVAEEGISVPLQVIRFNQTDKLDIADVDIKNNNVEYYQMIEHPLQHTSGEKKCKLDKIEYIIDTIQAQHKQIKFYSGEEICDTISFGGLYQPVICIRGNSAESNPISIYNQTEEVLNVAMEVDTVAYDIKRGIVKKLYNVFKFKDTAYMLYEVNVKILDKNNSMHTLAEVTTTKME